MKFPFTLLAVWLSLAITAPTSAQAQASPQDTTTVYITRTGEKYHKGTCHYLKYTRIKTTLKEARESGYEACLVCKPVTVGNAPGEKSNEQRSTAVQCSATTQAGARCKRMTKNGSRRCWQHGG